jgi:hypothetical protein
MSNRMWHVTVAGASSGASRGSDGHVQEKSSWLRVGNVVEMPAGPIYDTEFEGASWPNPKLLAPSQ